MTAPAFIGDEVPEAAYRLAGMVSEVPVKRAGACAFARAAGATTLLIITTVYAAARPGETPPEAIRRADPLILVVPDGVNRRAPADLDSRVDRVLGIER